MIGGACFQTRMTRPHREGGWPRVLHMNNADKLDLNRHAFLAIVTLIANQDSVQR